MFTRKIKAGSTDQSVVIRIIDSTDGTPETGVEHNTSGIDLQYRREGAASTAITEVALAALTTAHTDGGIEHIGNGYYRLDLPDAAVADGVTGVLVHGTVTGMIVIGTYIELVDYDPYDGVSLGLGALSDIESSLVIVKSDLVVVESDTTAIESELIQVHSETTVVQSDTAAIETATATTASDLAAIESELIVVHSETTVIQSDTTAIEAGGGGLTAAQSSQLAQAHSDIIIVGSDVVQIYSDTTAIHSQTTVIESDTTVLEAGVDVVSYNGVTVAVTGQIQAVTADTPTTGVTRITIQDPTLDSDANDQFNGGTFYLVDRSQQKVLDAGVVGDYDGTSFYVFVDDLAVTPTTAMDYLLAFGPKASPTAGDIPDVNVTQVAGTAQTAADLAAALSDVESSLVIVKSDLVLVSSDTTAIESELIQVHSETTVIQSDSTVLEAAVSDVESSLVIVKSDLVVVSSDTAAIESGGGSLTAAQASQLTAIQSDTTQIQSDTTAIEAGGGSLTATQASQLARIQSDVIIVGSDLLQVYSDTTVIASDVVALPQDVWEYVITGSLPNGSAGKFLREASEAVAAVTGTAQSATASTLQLASGAFPVTASDNYFRGERVTIIEGTGAGQSRIITGGTASTDTVALGQSDWDITPSTDSVYAITGAEVDLRLVAGQIALATGSVDFDDLATLTAAVSDVESSLVIVKSDLAVIESDTTVIESDTTAIHSQTTVVESDVALLFSAHAEPTGVPAANESPVDKIGRLYMAMRNRVDVTATKKTFYDDAGTAEWEQDLSDDGTTYSQSEANAV